MFDKAKSVVLATPLRPLAAQAVLSPPPTSSKRTSPSTSPVETKPAKRMKRSGSDSDQSSGVSTRRSAAVDRNNRNAWKDGTFVISNVKLAAWKKKIFEADPDTEFKPMNPVEAKCSKCRTFIKAKQPYDSYRFRKHFTGCKGTNMMTLEEMAATHGFGFIDPHAAVPVATDQHPHPEYETRPCPGVTKHDDERIATYLQRCGATGGGGDGLPGLAQERYGKTYSLLSSAQKAIIDEIYYASLTWHNEQWRGRVISTSCAREVSCIRDAVAKPCAPCAALLSNADFDRALKRDSALEKNLIYTNKRYQDPILGKLFIMTAGLRELVQEAGNPYVRYALGVAAGTYQDNKVLSGLMISQLTVEDKAARGVGKQNFRWPKEYDQFLHVLAIDSPKTLRTISQYLPARSARSFQ